MLSLKNCLRPVKCRKNNGTPNLSTGAFLRAVLAFPFYFSKQYCKSDLAALQPPRSLLLDSWKLAKKNKHDL